MKIVIDVFGGDNAPKEIIEGAILAIAENKDLEIILTGDEMKIYQILAGRNERVSVAHAPDVIENNESPTEAIRHKKDSSLVRAFDILKDNEDVIALISAGNTGAILAGGILKIGRIKGVSRPSLAPILPTKKESDVILIDGGSNIDCKAEQLAQFAVMGAAYYSVMFGAESPRVGLLNIGAEEGKGNELAKEAYAEIKKLPINFVGNMEARDYMSGNYDVVVADGFSGNVLLKGTEGAVMAAFSVIKQNVKKSFWAKFGYLFMKGAFSRVKNKMNMDAHGGSPLIGCKKLVIKNHGSSVRSNVVASVRSALMLNEKKLIEKIQEQIGKMEG